ncbi:MAG: aryl-sulfate sulfotransferase [bacterium]
MMPSVTRPPGLRLLLTCLLLPAALGLAGGTDRNSTAEPFDGLTLVNALTSSTMRLVANDGRTVNVWHCGKPVAYMPYLMPDSTVWRPGRHPNPQLHPGAWGGLIERYNWHGDIIQSFEWSGPDHIQHHDIYPMPNGNVLVLSVDRRTREEARAAGRVDIATDHLWSEMIVEYDPYTHTVVWVWRLWDHLIQDVDSTLPDYGKVSEHPGRLDINVGAIQAPGDWIHLNAVDYWEEEDLVIISSNRLSELYVIDHSTTTEEARGSAGGRHGRGGDFLYRWGNPQNYGRGGPADQRFFTVHGVNSIRPGLPGEGNILAFNNGNRPDSQYSSVEEIIPPRDSLGRFILPPDSAFGPTEPVWVYADPGAFYSPSYSGAFRLPNGNTLITEGVRGRVFEVTPGGEVVWTYNLGAQTGRVQKHPWRFAHQSEPFPAPGVRPSVISGTLLLPASSPRAELLDASGRRAARLRSGANSIAHLRPGVYFVRQAATGEQPVTTKILLTR